MWQRHWKYRFIYFSQCHGRKSYLGNGILLILFMLNVFEICHFTTCRFLVFSQLVVLLHGLMENLKLLSSIYYLFPPGQPVSFHILYPVSSNQLDIEWAHWILSFCMYFWLPKFIAFSLLTLAFFLFAAVISNCWLNDLAGNTGYDKWS